MLNNNVETRTLTVAALTADEIKLNATLIDLNTEQAYELNVYLSKFDEPSKKWIADPTLETKMDELLQKAGFKPVRTIIEASQAGDIITAGVTSQVAVYVNDETNRAYLNPPPVNTIDSELAAWINKNGNLVFEPAAVTEFKGVRFQPQISFTHPDGQTRVKLRVSQLWSDSLEKMVSMKYETSAMRQLAMAIRDGKVEDPENSEIAYNIMSGNARTDRARLIEDAVGYDVVGMMEQGEGFSLTNVRAEKYAIGNNKGYYLTGVVAGVGPVA